MDQVYEYKDHWDYLTARLGPKTQRHGNKSRFATFLRMQPAFLSQVLTGKFALNLEQADLTNQFFEHTPEESDYFLLVVNRDRAGTDSLKKYYETKIAELLKRRQSLIERLGKNTTISEQVQGVYYSSWVYAAVHSACRIPELGTRSAIAHYLALPSSVVANALQFLLENSFVKKEGDSYTTTNQWIRLGKNSPHIVKLHSHWRQKAIQNLESQREEDLHYSGLICIDEKTARKIKDLCLDLIKTAMKDIEAARDEDLYVFDMDLFLLKSRS